MKKTFLLSLTIAGALLHTASAQSVLYTTTQDFSQFSGGTPTTDITRYSDNSSVNGVANYSAAGNSGTAGSLQLTSPGGWSQSISYEPNGAWDQGFLSAIDPGAIAGTSLTAYSGVISFDVFRGNLTDWNDFGIGLNYNGFWGTFWKSSATDFTGADGNTWTRYTVPYTINATSGLTYFNLGIAQNAGSTAGQTLFVDNIQVVPEPSTFALAGLGFVALLVGRRK